jgi:hypothetical protein
MKTTILRCIFTVACALAAIATLPAAAQTIALRGRVSEQGESIDKASVIATQLATGAVVRTTSDAAGGYVLDTLGAGAWRVVATAPSGAQAAQRITLRPGSAVSLHLSLHRLSVVLAPVVIVGPRGAGDGTPTATLVRVIEEPPKPKKSLPPPIEEGLPERGLRLAPLVARPVLLGAAEDGEPMSPVPWRLDPVPAPSFALASASASGEGLALEHIDWPLEGRLHEMSVAVRSTRFDSMGLADVR